MTFYRYRFFFAISLVTAFVIVALFPACENEPSRNQVNSAFIGGEIVNPNATYTVLRRNNETIDTIPLTKKNWFSYTLGEPKAGIYVLKHRPEALNLYIYPGDSLLLRVNTLAFDESVHFSGIGSERNNFMKEMFLRDESNADLVLSSYKVHPKEFERKADSVFQVRLMELEAARKKRKFPDDFVELAQKVIRYESYDLRERYLYLIHKYYKEYIKEIPESFYSYRENVDFNEESLQSSPAYRRFIDNYLINRSLKWCAGSGIDDSDCSDLSNHKNILFRLEEAAKLIKLPPLRRHFLTKISVLGVVMANKEEEMKEVLRLLQELDYPQSDLQDLRQMAAIQVAYLPGTTLEVTPLINMDAEELTMKEVVNRPTIIFLWSIYNRNHQADHRLISDMRKKYPEIDFIGINLDVGEVRDWQEVVEDYGYPVQKEFQLGRTRINKRFFQYYLNKLLFLDASGKVVIGDAFINSPELESRIVEFLNR